MKTKVMGMLALLMIALTVAGFAYATWSDMVTIEGKVEMGELIVGWYNTTPYLIEWDETTNGFPEDEAGHGFVPKPWVANATIQLSEDETSKHHDPQETVYKNMTIIAENAYPQWDCNVTAWLKNAGTIPAKVNPDFSLYFYDATDEEELGFRIIAQGGPDFVDSISNVLVSPYWIEGAVVDPVVGDIINFYIEFWVPVDWQLEPCTAHKVHIEIDFKQEAEECHTYTFEVGIEAIQWNKATW